MEVPAAHAIKRRLLTNCFTVYDRQFIEECGDILCQEISKASEVRGTSISLPYATWVGEIYHLIRIQYFLVSVLRVLSTFLPDRRGTT